MKKKTFLLFVVLIFSLTSFVYAGNLVKKVYFSPYPILIDDEEYSSEMPILSYQDRTYVALREFSEMVGVEIDFMEETIIINTKKDYVGDFRNEKEDTITKEKDLLSAQNDTEIESVSPSKSSIVYITKTGTKYHMKSNCSKGNYYTSTLDSATQNGYTACKRCVN